MNSDVTALTLNDYEDYYTVSPFSIVVIFYFPDQERIVPC